MYDSPFLLSSMIMAVYVNKETYVSLNFWAMWRRKPLANINEYEAWAKKIIVSVLNSFVLYKSFVYFICSRTSQDRISNVTHSCVRINWSCVLHLGYVKIPVIQKGSLTSLSSLLCCPQVRSQVSYIQKFLVGLK